MNITIIEHLEYRLPTVKAVSGQYSRLPTVKAVSGQYSRLTTVKAVSGQYRVCYAHAHIFTFWTAPSVQWLL